MKFGIRELDLLNPYDGDTAATFDLFSVSFNSYK